jgi:hypothetical protein
MATQEQQAAAASKPPQHKEVEHFSDAERDKWLKTGEMPLLETEEKASPVKEDGKQAPSTPVKESAGSGPAKKTSEEKDAEKELNFKALRERTERVEAELEEYRTGKKKFEEKKPDSAAASTAPKLLEMPKRPSMAQYSKDGALDYEKYEAALDQYDKDKDAYTNQQVQLRTAAQEMERIVGQQKVELKTKYGEKSDSIDVKKTMDKLGETVKEAPAFFMFLNDSEVFTDLLYVLGTDPKLDELLAEAKDPKTVTRAVRKLVALEAGVKAELAKGAAKPNGQELPPKKEAKLTQAGKPPAEAAGGNSSPEDDGSSGAAWRRKDLSTAERGELYRERKNKEEREKRHKKVN